MKQYVLGFMFSLDGKSVVLIRKTKPNWQAGRLNAIGGKIESGELIDQAMVREFEEETGLHYDRWKYLGIMRGNKSWAVHLFGAVTNDVYDVQTTTDEEVILVCVNAAIIKDPEKSISNLKWLIPLIYDRIFNFDGPRHIEINY